MKRIYLYDFKKGEREEIEVEDLISDDLKKQIVRFGNNIGLKLKTEEIMDAEEFAQFFFEKKGYKLIRCCCKNATFINNEIHELEQQSKLPPEISKHACLVGVPDYFCYKSQQDWFFVEVKNLQDTLKYKQITWMFRYDYKVKLMFVE